MVDPPFWFAAALIYKNRKRCMAETFVVHRVEYFHAWVYEEGLHVGGLCITDVGRSSMGILPTIEFDPGHKRVKEDSSTSRMAEVARN